MFERPDLTERDKIDILAEKILGRLLTPYKMFTISEDRGGT